MLDHHAAWDASTGSIGTSPKGAALMIVSFLVQKLRSTGTSPAVAELFQLQAAELLLYYCSCNIVAIAQQN